MIYDKIQFPIFPVHTDEITLVDGILWIENQVLDDKNMKGKTLGIRRLQSPMKSIYPVKYMIKDIRSYLDHQGKFYIDNTGYFFRKDKTKKATLKYHKILRVDLKTIASVLWVKDCPFPFTLDRPLRDDQTWAGILYRDSIPWLLYDTSTEKKKNSWRKI
tara:strand:- start:424 stop:903 length:480 start_codon:yes stop_codon:yes gene_type:complete